MSIPSLAVPSSDESLSEDPLADDADPTSSDSAWLPAEDEAAWLSPSVPESAAPMVIPAIRTTTTAVAMSQGRYVRLAPDEEANGEGEVEAAGAALVPGGCGGAAPVTDDVGRTFGEAVAVGAVVEAAGGDGRAEPATVGAIGGALVGGLFGGGSGVGEMGFGRAMTTVASASSIISPHAMQNTAPGAKASPQDGQMSSKENHLPASP